MVPAETGENEVVFCEGCGYAANVDKATSQVQSPSSSVKSTMEDRKSKVGGPEEAPEVLVTFNLPLSEKLPLDESLVLISKQGYQRLLLEGEITRLDELASRFTNHVSRITSLTVIQDRLKLTPASRPRFIRSTTSA